MSCLDVQKKTKKHHFPDPKWSEQCAARYKVGPYDRYKWSYGALFFHGRKKMSNWSHNPCKWSYNPNNW